MSGSEYHLQKKKKISNQSILAWDKRTANFLADYINK